MTPSAALRTRSLRTEGRGPPGLRARSAGTEIIRIAPVPDVTDTARLGPATRRTQRLPAAR